jgi:hypothetical protein
MASGEGSHFSDVQLGGSHARVFTQAIEPGVAIQAAQTVDEQDRAIDRLAVILALVGIGGVGLAGGLGLVVTRTATRPGRELSAAAEHVAKTRDLSRRYASRHQEPTSSAASPLPSTPCWRRSTARCAPSASWCPTLPMICAPR